MLASARSIARQLLEIARGLKVFIADTASRAIGLDLEGRGHIAALTSGKSNDELLGYVEPEFIELANRMSMAGLSLDVSPEDIKPLSVEGIEDGNDASVSCEVAADVFWDIVLDALGLLDEKTLIIEALREVAGFEELESELTRRGNEADYTRLIDGCLDAVKFLFLNEGVINALFEKAGNRVALKVLKSALVRAVPYVGWGYTAIAIGFSLHRHWDRRIC